MRALTLLVLCWLAGTRAWAPLRIAGRQWGMRLLSQGSSEVSNNTPVLSVETGSIFEIDEADANVDVLQKQILQLSAALDRGQMFNPTSGTQYSEPMAVAKSLIKKLCGTQSTKNDWTIADMDGEWELVYSSVPHGLFRSSPFFLAIQDAYAAGGDASKANLFFKLHELQVLSWGISKIGRVAQVIDGKSGIFISEFDTNLLSLTVIPFFGWGKLLPTFGGCVVTVSKIIEMQSDGLLKVTSRRSSPLWPRLLRD